MSKLSQIIEVGRQAQNGTGGRTLPSAPVSTTPATSTRGQAGSVLSRAIQSARQGQDIRQAQPAMATPGTEGTAQPKRQADAPDLEQMKLRLEELNKQIQQAETEQRLLSLETPYGAARLPAGWSGASGVNRRSDGLPQRISKLKAERNDLLKQYYAQDNEQALADLDKDQAKKSLYETARAGDGDLETLVRRMSDQLDRGGRPEDDPAALEQISRRLGISPERSGSTAQYMNDLAAALEQDLDTSNRQAEAMEQLRQSGEMESYNRLTRYQKAKEDAQKYVQAQEGIQQLAREDPVLASALTVPLAPFQGLDFLGAAAHALGPTGNPEKPESYEPLNAYNMDTTNFVSGVRGAVAKDIEEKTKGAELFGQNVPAFLYQTGMSMADSAAQAALLGPAASLFMGGAAASSQVQDIISRGGDNRQALMGGLAAGAAEALFEKISLGNLLKPKSITGWKSLLKETAKQAGVEGSEEVFTEIANILSDAAIMGENSSVKLAMQRYMGKNHLSKEDAQKQVFLDCIGQVVLAGAGGVLSGGVMGGGKSMIDWAVTGAQRAKAARQGAIASEGTETPKMADTGLASPDTAMQDAGASVYPVQDETATQGPSAEDGSDPLVAATAGQKETASTGEAGRLRRMTMADFTDVGSRVWNNVEYGDTKTQRQTTQKVHQEMVDAGQVVKIPERTIEQIGQSYPDLRAVGKSERTPILRQKMIELKTTLRQFLNVLKGSTFEFEVNGNILDATLYDTGVKEVMEKITRDKASMLLHSDQIFQNARYLYSMPDYSGDPNVYRWNYFYTPVQIGDEIVGVRIAVRDIATPQESQIYNWGIKKGATLGGEGRGQSRISSDTSSATPQDALLDGGRYPLSGTSSDVSSTASSDTTIPQTESGVKGEYSPEGGAFTQAIPGQENITPGDVDNSVGAAARGFTTPGTTPTERTSRLAEGVLHSTPSRREAAGGLTRQQWSDLFRYQVQSEEQSMQYAKEQLYHLVDGKEVFLADISPKSYRALTDELKAAPSWNGVMTDMAAMIATELEGRSVNYELGEDVYLDWVDTMRQKATETGRGTQAWAKWSRVLRDMSPEYRLELIDRSLSRYAREHNISSGITISEDVRNAFLNAETEAARDNAIGDMQREVAAQLPTSLLDKWNALRYLNMLGNFRTQARNVIGNVGMQAMTQAKNAVATGIEALVDKVSGGKLERTKGLAGAELRKAAAADFENVRDAVMGGGKYSLTEGKGKSDAEGIISGAMEQRRIFKNAPMESYRKATNWAMEAGDEIFSKPAYSVALAGYLKAHGVTAAEFSSDTWKSQHQDLVDKARQYAIKDAQESTFRDNNKISTWISKAGRGKNTPGAIKALSEGLMPFRKTPANVAIRAEEYSPLGLINTAVLAAQKASGNTKVTGAQIIDQLSKSLTGAGVFLLGMGLRNMGLLRGGDDKDKDQAYFDDLNGHQPYSLELPDGTSYTLDWLSPGAIPLFMGAAFEDGVERGGFQLSDIEGAISVMSEPMLEMSMLSGIRDALDSVKYSDNSFFQVLGDVAVSYATQGLSNNLLGQLERSSESERQSTYVEHDSPIPAWLQREIGRVSAKTPGWDYHQIPYINAWGETEGSGDPLQRVLVNTVSPGYVSKVKEGPVEEELQRLAKALETTNLYPDNAKRYFQVGGETKYLTADEYVKYATAKGKESRRLVEALMGSEGYKALPDEQKAGAIQKAYEWANAKAKEKVSDYVPGPSSWLNKAQMAVDAGIPIEEYILLKMGLDADGNGRVSQDEARAALDGQKEISQEQKADLWAIINASWKTTPYK